MKESRIIFSSNASKISLLIIAVELFCFAFLTVFITKDGRMDDAVSSYISKHITAGRTQFMYWLTFLGNPAFIIPAVLLLIVFYLHKGKKIFALGLFLISLSGVSAMSLLKQLFRRQRPPDPLILGSQWACFYECCFLWVAYLFCFD
jgi:hypothetical protein